MSTNQATANDDADASLSTAQQLYDEAMSERDNDASYAAELFSRALEIRNRHFGESAVETADTYLRYGVSLFEAARDERTHETLGAKAIEQAGAPRASAAAGSSAAGPSSMFKDDPEVSSESAGEEDEEAEGDDQDEEETGASAAAAAAAAAAAGGSSIAATAPSDAAPNATNTDASSPHATESQAAAPCTSASDPPPGPKAGKHRVRPGGSGGKALEDMDLAYEVLETARCIYLKDGEEKHAAPLALLYRTIGEIKGEEGNFDASVEDLLVSIEYQHQVPPHNPRRLAELHFLLSKTLQMADRQAEAARHW
ncbi:MAG: hypothetical protein WDW38_006138 [Sanguina aurantia]